MSVFPSPSVYTLTPPFIFDLFSSPCLTDVGCHLHTVWRDRVGIFTYHLPSSCDGQQFRHVRTVWLVKPRSIFCICTGSSFCASVSYFMALSYVKKIKKIKTMPPSSSHECSRALRLCAREKMETNASAIEGMIFVVEGCLE